MYHTSLKGITSFPCICLLCSVLPPLPPSAFRAHTCVYVARAKVNVSIKLPTMSRDTRYTYQYRIRCDVTRLNLPGHMIAVGTPAIRHIHVNITVYVSCYTETDTTGMLSPPTVSAFSVTADIRINSIMFFFYFYLSGVCPDCCVVSVVASV